MTAWPVVALSLGSALAFATSSTLKHASAGQVPDAQDLAPRSLGRFVRATVSHRLWLAGIGADVVGLALQVTALHLGALAVVQPLLVSGLVFALVIRQVRVRRVSPVEIGWAVVLAAALAGFLLLAGTARHPVVGAAADRTPAVVAGVVGVVLAGACVGIGRLHPRGRRSAALLGVAVGAVFAATAALLKSLTDVATDHGVLAVLTSWQLPVVVVAGGLGLLLNQLAFQAGPLTASLPASATVDPLLSIALGVAVYDEHLRRGTGAAIGLGALLLVLGVAVIALARTAASGDPESGDPESGDQVDEQPAGSLTPPGRRAARPERRADR